MGRYQPLHKGHIKLIRTALDIGKRVCIAIKIMPRDRNNPFSYKARRKMFLDVFAKEIRSKKMRIIPIPDIDEVCWGRKVGWGVREIKLDSETEAISATQIRKANNFK